MDSTSPIDKDTFDIITNEFDAAHIPRMTGLQFYESEVYGHCMGFQMIYEGHTENQFIVLDTNNNICRTTSIVLSENQYISDVQVGSTDVDSKSISLLFATNDGQEEHCGTYSDNYRSLIAQGDEKQANALLYLAAQIDGKTTEENYLVELEAIYIDLNDLTSDMVAEFMAKSGATFADPLEGYVDVEGSLQAHLYNHEVSSYIDANILDMT